MKQQAGRLGAAIRTHNLKQKLLNDLQGRRFEKEEVQQAKAEAPVKVVETTAEPFADWSMLALAAGGVLGYIVQFNQTIISPPAAKQINEVPLMPLQAS